MSRVLGDIFCDLDPKVKGQIMYFTCKRISSSGFALGFIFLSPPFSPIRFFLCHFLELRARFWPIFAKKEPGLGAIFRKKCLLSLTPLILVDYCTHIDKITKE